MKKRLSALILALTLVLSLAACGGSGSSGSSSGSAGGNSGASSSGSGDSNGSGSAAAVDGDPITLTLATCAADDAIDSIVAFKLADKLSALSGGNITADVYTNAQLGGLSDTIQAVKAGSVDMVFTTVGSLESSAPSLCTISWLYSYESEDHCYAVWNSELGQSVKQDIIDLANLHCPDMYYASWRALFSTTEMKSIDDLAGKKLRIAEVPLFVNSFTALGANPVYIDMSEIYSALSTGVCDVVEQQLDVYATNKLYEQAPYVFMDNHAFSFAAPIINESRYQSMTDSQKAVFDQACLEACAEAREEYYDIMEGIMNTLEEGGCTFYYVTPEERAEIREKLHDVTLDYISEYGDQSTLDLIESLA